MKRLFGLLCVFVLLVSCGEKSEKPGADSVTHQPEKLLISAHTSGEISTTSAVRIQFATDMVTEAEVASSLSDSPIRLDPKIKGKATWANRKTLVFQPDNPLPAGEDFEATLTISDSSGTPQSYMFSFSTLHQAFDIRFEELRTPEADRLEIQSFTGRITTADVVPLKKIQGTLTPKQGNRTLPISWSQSDDKRTHTFQIKNIKRSEKISSILISWNGNPIGVDERGEESITIPPLSTFEVTQIGAVQSYESSVEIQFSDPVDPEQNLDGLIRVDGKSDLRFSINSNVVQVYSASRWAIETRVFVETGIRNTEGASLNTPQIAVIQFERLLPEVRFTGNGVIFPTSKGLTIPVETVNLSAVMVKATRIFDQNMAQFFQVNDLDGDQEMYRVGKVVWKEVVPLELPVDKADSWTRVGLDMSELIRDHKPGLYRLELTFLRPHILYDCAAVTSDEQTLVDEFLEAWTNEAAGEPSYWDYWGQDYDYSDYYRNRRNPCHPAFYQDYYDHNVTVARNVLISDIGLTAKSGDQDSLFVFVTDMRTSRPLKDVELTVQDFEQQQIGRGRSDSDGFAFFQTEGKPFMLSARYKEQISYLKLQDGYALSVSHFDVGGSITQAGIKGFIYGERGVWRPGDDVYLTFILMDASERLPENHPVKFELRDPRGRLVESRTVTESVNGFYPFHFKTGINAPTGNWQARIVVGGSVFEKSLKIETIMPNRLKMALNFGEDVTALKGGSIAADLSAEWLHGAPANGLSADVEIGFNPAKTRFPTHSDYQFDDPARDFYPETQMLFEGILNAQGNVRFDADVQVQNMAPGMLTANFKTRVFEPGGAFSVDRFSLPYHPYDQYVGIRAPKGDKARGMLLTDTTHTIDLVLVDTDGALIQTGDLDVELYKIKWRWWWEKGSESLADYIGKQSYAPLEKSTVRIQNGKGSWKLKVKYPSWGRYLIRAIDRESGHSTGLIKYIDWPGWAGRAQEDGAGSAHVLAFTSDKTDYLVGETATLSIPSGQSGRILLTLETGSKILNARWIDTQDGGTQVSFKITRAMAPTVYAHATLLQPHMNTGNDLPIRLYGVVPIKVTDTETRISPEFKTADVFEPLSKQEVRVSEKNGQAMAYTLAVVDEGLLGLTRFRTPDPWNHFYQKEALGIQTWDLYSHVAGAYAGELERLLAIGGGEVGEAKGQQRANRFPPMVRFYGPFDLKKGKTAKHELDIPQYIGEVRVMLVAGAGSAFGLADKQVKVKKPLMLLGTLPRVISVGESVTLPISVFALDEKIRDVQVKIDVSGPLSIDGEDKKGLTFETIGDQLAKFKLRAGNRTGVAKVRMKASGSGESIAQTIEIDVRIPTERVVDVVDTVLLDKETWTRTLGLPGLPGTNRALLELSRIPPIDLEKHLRFLIRYPHGCIEQTTSSVFPQLYLGYLVDLIDEQENEIQTNITAGISRITEFQTHDGGFGYWPGNPESQAWGSNYAGHFLIEAKNLGYHVPSGLLRDWRSYQNEQARHWSDNRKRADLIQAYRLYTLALEGHPELSAMNRLKEQPNLSTTARYRLAAAYELAGQREAALDLIRGPIDIPEYQELSNTYGSSLRDKAMVLETLTLMEKQTEAMDLVKILAERLSMDAWMSTQTTAYCLLALGKTLQLYPPGESVKIRYTWNGGRETKATTDKPVMQITLPLDQEVHASLELKQEGQGTLYPRIILEGLPEPGQEASASNGLNVKVTYMDLDGSSLEIDKLGQGTDFLAEVTVTHTGHGDAYEELALTHLIPAGWEIHNGRLDLSESEKTAMFEYQDIRDDRILTYFDLAQKKSKTFRVRLNAAYVGRYYLPPISCEAMYDATIYGRVKGRWIEVVAAE